MDRTAPILAVNGVVIDAPVSTVWRLIIDIDRWPTWQPKVDSARLDGPLSVGRTFRWRYDGTAITSRVVRLGPGEAIVWTGEAIGLNATHAWTMRQVGRSTQVRTAESMRGWPASLFYSSEQLGAANAAWLRALKRRAEKDTSR